MYNHDRGWLQILFCDKHYGFLDPCKVILVFLVLIVPPLALLQHLF